MLKTPSRVKPVSGKGRVIVKLRTKMCVHCGAILVDAVLVFLLHLDLIFHTDLYMSEHPDQLDVFVLFLSCFHSGMK